MLVVNERADAPYTEKAVAEWLRACRVPGLAVAGAHVPGRRRGDAGQEADFIVFTPHSCVCIEVKGTLSPSGGSLSCPVNGSWSMLGYVGDPVHVRKGDVNPIYQAKSAMYALKALTKNATGAEQFVSALVVVVPRSGTTVTLDKPTKQMMPKGVDILLGSRPNDLYAWFQRRKFHREVWTVDRVRAMLGGLGVNDPGASPEALSVEGFTPGIKISTPIENLSQGDFVDRRHTSAIEVPSYVAPVAATGSLSWSSVIEPAPATPRPQRVRRRTGGRRHKSVESALLAIVAAGVVGAGVWYVLDGSHSLSRNDHGSNVVITSVTDSPGGVPPQADSPEPSQAPPTYAQGTQACYPFQPNC